jgi:membrane-bound lytic murein transglycosylase MltF
VLTEKCVRVWVWVAVLWFGVSVQNLVENSKEKLKEIKGKHMGKCQKKYLLVSRCSGSAVNGRLNLYRKVWKKYKSGSGWRVLKGLIKWASPRVA